MKNITTKHLNTALGNIAKRIRTDLVMSVGSVKTKTGGYYWIWLSEAGCAQSVWQIDFYEGRPNRIELPEVLTTEKE